MEAVAPSKQCSNCGAANALEYCPRCGQAQPKPGDYSLRSLFAAALEELLSYDGRIWATLRTLFFRPGELARAHFDGQRIKYIGPLRTFLAANFVAWLVIPYVNIVGFSVALAKKVVLFPALWSRALEIRAQLSGVSVEAFTARIEAIGSAEDAATVLCMIPLFASGAALVMLGRGHPFVLHVVFAAHFYCIHLLGVLLVIGAGLGPAAGWLRGHPDSPAAVFALGAVRNFWVQHLLVAPLLLPWLFVALKRAYSLTPAQSGWRSGLLTLWACAVSRSFFDLAFGLVLVLA